MKNNKNRDENTRLILKKKLQKACVYGLRLVSVLIWLAVILVCFWNRDKISVEGILRYTPQNPLLAAIIMLVFFAFKSLSLVIYSGILYATNGILFPLPVAFLINLLGSVIMLSIPYRIGKKTGKAAVDSIREKYPKTKVISEFRMKNDFFFSYVIRIIRIPSDVASLYMGAVGVNYLQYLSGSLLGMLPHMITYPVMGMSVSDVSSPAFLISFGAEILYIVITTAAYALYRKRREKKKPDEKEGNRS